MVKRIKCVLDSRLLRSQPRGCSVADSAGSGCWFYCFRGGPSVFLRSEQFFPFRGLYSGALLRVPGSRLSEEILRVPVMRPESGSGMSLFVLQTERPGGSGDQAICDWVQCAG